jgi:hypothetical protein
VAEPRRDDGGVAGTTADRLLGLTAAIVLLLAAWLPVADRRLQALVMLALLGALGTVGRALSCWLVPDLPPASAAVAAFTCAVAFDQAVTLALGHAGWLRPELFLAVVAAVALATLALPRCAPPPAMNVAAPIATVCSSIPRPREPLFAHVEAALIRAAVAALAVGYAAEAVVRFGLPPGTGPDDLSYHLTAVAVWQRFADLRMVKLPMGDWSPSFYPLLPELASWSLLAPFRDSDIVARWSELPFALFSFVAVAAIARRLGLGLRATALSVVLYGLLRRVAALAFAAGNDHVAAFATLAALDAALLCGEPAGGRHVGERRFGEVGRFVYLGLCLGLLVASKYLGIQVAAIVLAVLVVALLSRRRERGARPRPTFVVAALSGLVLAALVVGGYGYLRNWVSAGNPVYPQLVTVGGRTVFAGRPELSLAARMGGAEAHIDLWEFLASPDNRFASFFPYTLLPAALLAPLLAAWRRRPLLAAALFVPLVSFLEFLFLTHDHRDIRYFLAGVAMAAVAFGWLTEQLGSVGRWLRIAAAAVAVVNFTRWTRWHGPLALALAFALVAAAAAWPALQARAAWRRAREHGALGGPSGSALSGATVALVAVLAALGAVALGACVEGYQAGRLREAPAALALERLAGPRGARVAYVGYNAPYLFFGSRLQNDVRIVPRSSNPVAEFYGWGVSPRRPQPPGLYSRWRSLLERLGVQYVVVVRGADEDPERRWMANHWDVFRRVYTSDETENWQVLPRPEQAHRGRPDAASAARGASAPTRQRGQPPGGGSRR